jgi:hypothetical protein
MTGIGTSPVLASQDQITEITLERTMCFGTCPAYKVILRQDGTAIYIGKAFVERKGRYQGTVYKYYFDRLVKLLQALNYFALKDNYSKPVTDLPTVITTVLQGDKLKNIRNYGNVGPIELWGIEMAIDAVATRVKWEKIHDD